MEKRTIATADLWHGDCFHVMPQLPDKSVDLVLTDLPYGTTDCKWDKTLPLDDLWANYRRLLKPGGAIILTASQPFTSLLVVSNLKEFKVEWIWEKNAGSNFGTVKWQPMKEHESVLVFANGTPCYNPIMEQRAPSGLARVQTVVNYNTRAPKCMKRESSTDRCHRSARTCATPVHCRSSTVSEDCTRHKSLWP